MQPARAQYYASSEAGYRLAAVSAGEALAIAPDSPEFAALKGAAAGQGLELHGAFRVQAGMSRYFGFNTFSLTEQGQASPLEEQQLTSSRPQRLAPVELLSYHFDGRDVVIGLGQEIDTDPETFDWRPLQVLSFALDSAGANAELLASWELGAQYSDGIYALDMLRDGVIELLVPWATGVAGGGGVDVMAVVPTGGLAGFEGLQGDGFGTRSSFYSTHGNVNLLDYDGDGNWEFETVYPLFAAVFAYSYPTLYVFDQPSWSFIDAQGRFPQYYAAHKHFYQHLLQELELALQSPQNYYRAVDPWIEGPGYSVEMEGEVLTLAPFMTAAEDPARPSLDYSNIETLRSLLADGS